MRRLRVWNGGVSAIAAVIVFILTYMLILPAITMTKDPTCGLEEHTHGPECYETRTVKRIACPYEEFDGLVLHKHDENCRNEAGELICTLEETIVEETVEEQEALPVVEEFVLDAEPTQMPTQELADEEAVVAKEEPIEESLLEEPALAAEETEVLGEPELIAEEVALAEEEVLAEEELLLEAEEEAEKEDLTHLHTAECYDASGNLICGRQQVVYHQHDESCFKYEKEEVLICGKQEHVHTDECYASIEENVSLEHEGGIVLDGEDGQLTTEEELASEEEAVLVEEETAPIEYITQEVASEETEDGIVFFLEPKIEVEEEATLEATEEAEEESESAIIVEEESLTQAEDAQDETLDSADGLVGEESTTALAEEEELMPAEEELQEIAEEEPKDEVAEQSEEAVLGEEEAVSEEESLEGIEEEEVALEDETDLSEIASDEEAETVEEELLDSEAAEEGPLGLDEVLTEEDGEDIILDEKPQLKNLIYNGLDYHVTLSYEDGIPDGASLEVREIKGAEFDSYLASAKDNLGVKVLPVSLARFFDITILLNGEEIEPTSAVQVQISYDDPVHVNGKLNVIHFEDEENVTVFSADHAESGTEEEALVEEADILTDTEIIQEEAAVEEEEPVEAALIEEPVEDETGVSFEAESFSVYGVVYTLDFEKIVAGTYSIEGARAGLGIILYSLGFDSLDVSQIIEAEFSNPDVVAVYKDEDGQWYLESIRPFDTEELLSVYFMDGTLVEITVEDAQMWTYYLDAEGDTYYISVTYDESAGIPDNAQLVVREIQEGTLEYEQCMEQTRSQVEDGETVQMAKFFDITIVVDGEEIQPTAPVEVKIRLAEEISERIRTLHITDQNEVDVLENEYQDNTVKFKAEGF